MTDKNASPGRAAPAAPADAESSAHADGRCPLEDAHDKYDEAHYFLEQMMREWHRPEPLRWSMNAFLQPLRDVTFYLQNLLAHEDGFRAWYEGQQAQMRADELLRKFVEGRNIIVKQRKLVVQGVAQIGMFRYRKPKLGMHVPVPAYHPSEYILRVHAPKLGFLDEEHTAIGEEYGVQRTWIVGELGEGNVLKLCDQAWAKIGHVLSAAHDFVGKERGGPRRHTGMIPHAAICSQRRM